MNLKGKKTKNQVVAANIFEQQELLKKAEVIRENLTASTWHELGTNGKFDKNAKLSFISDDMLILGCDVGSETHYLRAIDTRGRELSKSAYSFRNNCEGFQSAKEWAVELAAKNEKKQIVLGLEPTGHYWFCLATWMIANGISGQQQRVAIARALAMQPELLLLDEPTSALDPEFVGEVLDIIRKATKEGYTMLLVSHEMSFIRNVSTKVVFLDGGKILEQGTPKEVFDHPKHDRVREFFKKMNRLEDPEYYI